MEQVMEKDKLATFIQDICGKEFGIMVEKKLKKFYPALKDNAAWREKFAKHIMADKSFNTISLMLKIGSSVDIFAKESYKNKRNEIKQKSGTTLKDLKEFPTLEEYISKIKKNEKLNDEGFGYNP